MLGRTVSQCIPLLLLLIASLTFPLAFAVELSGLVRSSSSGNKHQKHININGGIAVRSGEDVVGLVGSVWDDVVANHQDGLIDPKLARGGQQLALTKELTAKEALYHYKASRDGLVDSARFLVTFGVASSIATTIVSPLLRAIADNDIESARAILESGSVDVNDASADEAFESTPLHFAVSFAKRSEIVALLIANGANSEARARHGATPLMIAASLNNVDSIKVLCDEGKAMIETQHAFAKSTALHFAAEMGNVEAIKELCTRLVSGKVNDMRSSTGGTPLHTAADSNRPGAVRVLVENCGADPNSLLNGDTTPLYLAGQRGFHKVIRVIAELGASIDYVMPRESEFSKQKASSSKHVVPRSDDSKGGNGQVPYDYLNKNTELGNGATALHAAAENGHLRAVEELLDLGAAQLNTMEGSTPLVIALQYRHPTIAMRLLEGEGRSDPRVNAKTARDGAFALFVAAGYGFTDVVDTLLERKDTDMNLRNSLNASALSNAIYRNQLHIAEKLRKKGRAEVDLTCIQVAVQVKSNLPFVLDLIAEYIRRSTGSLNTVLNQVLAVTPFETYELELLRYLIASKRVEAFQHDSVTGATPLHVACQAGNEMAVKVMLKGREQFVDVRGEGQLSGATCLYLACAEGHVKTSEYLLRAGAHVSRGYILDYKNSRDHDFAEQIPPIFVAAEKGYVGIVDLLIAHGARYDEHAALQSDSDKVLPIELAANGGHHHIVKRLLTADTAFATLTAAITIAKEPYLTVKTIMDSGYMKGLGESITKHLTHLLINQREVAKAREHETVMAMLPLFIKGWSSHSKSVVFPPLHAAVVAFADESDTVQAERKALDYVLLLLQDEPLSLEIFEQITNNTKMTAMAFAVEMHRTSIVKVLLKTLARHEDFLVRVLQTQSGAGETPLQQAQRLRNGDLIRILGNSLNQESSSRDGL